MEFLRPIITKLAFILRVAALPGGLRPCSAPTRMDMPGDGDEVTRIGVKYFLMYLSQVQVLFHICKYKFKYSEYLEDIKYIKYFFNHC